VLIVRAVTVATMPKSRPWVMVNLLERSIIENAETIYVIKRADGEEYRR
jgi:hypothetical protein